MHMAPCNLSTALVFPPLLPAQPPDLVLVSSAKLQLPPTPSPLPPLPMLATTPPSLPPTYTAVAASQEHARDTLQPLLPLSFSSHCQLSHPISLWSAQPSCSHHHHFHLCPCCYPLHDILPHCCSCCMQPLNHMCVAPGDPSPALTYPPLPPPQPPDPSLVGQEKPQPPPPHSPLPLPTAPSLTPVSLPPPLLHLNCICMALIPSLPPQPPDPTPPYCDWDPKCCCYHRHHHQFRNPLTPPHSHGLPHSCYWHLKQRRPCRPQLLFASSQHNSLHWPLHSQN